MLDIIYNCFLEVRITSSNVVVTLIKSFQYLWCKTNIFTLKYLSLKISILNSMYIKTLYCKYYFKEFLIKMFNMFNMISVIKGSILKLFKLFKRPINSFNRYKSFLNFISCLGICTDDKTSLGLAL